MPNSIILIKFHYIYRLPMVIENVVKNIIKSNFKINIWFLLFKIYLLHSILIKLIP
jgi:hypothetical protein